MKVNKKKMNILIIVLVILTIIAVALYSNDSFKKSLGIDTRKEVKYDGSTDFSYEKPARCEDIRMDVTSYVINQLVFFGKEDASFNEVRELLKKYDGVIVGYKAKTNFYQVEFLDSTKEELRDKLIKLNDEELIVEYSADLNRDFILETLKSKYSKDKRVEINYTNGIEFNYAPRGNIVTQKVKSSSGKESEIQYAENIVRFCIDEKYDLDDIKEMGRKYGGVVVGYYPSPITHYCEIEFLNCDYDKLQEKIELINSEPMLEGFTAGIRLGYKPDTEDSE